MSDPLFEDELQKLILWAQGQPAAAAEVAATNKIVSRSAFNPFVEGSRRFQKKSECSTLSMNKRLIEFMRRDWARKVELREPERQRSLKHKMDERMRRGRQRQYFTDLHSILPHGTRHEKISIVQAAAAEIRELETRKEELQKSNHNLMDHLTREGRGEVGDGGQGRAKIRVRVENPTSGIDSLKEVLKCLKHMGLSIRSIGSQLSHQELSAVIEIDSEVEAAEVEAVVYRTLDEVDKWLLSERSLCLR